VDDGGVDIVDTAAQILQCGHYCVFVQNGIPSALMTALSIERCRGAGETEASCECQFRLPNELFLLRRAVWNRSRKAQLAPSYGIGLATIHRIADERQKKVFNNLMFCTARAISAI
jgi:hypothetical protein